MQRFQSINTQIRFGLGDDDDDDEGGEGGFKEDNSKLIELVTLIFEILTTEVNNLKVEHQVLLILTV